MANLSAFRGYLGHSDLDNNFAYLVSGLGFDAVEHPIDYIQDTLHPCHQRLSGALAGLRRVGHFAAAGTPVGLWLAESTVWPERPLDRDRIRRRTAKTLVEVEPQGDARVLIILTHRDQDDFELVFPRVRAKGEVTTVRALVSRSHPNNHHLQLLSDLEVISGLNLLGLSRRWANAFDVERVTKAFYLKFKAVRDRFIKELGEHNPHTLFGDETMVDEARRFVTRNLGRILFLWFLQSKGWLDDDQAYLLNLYESRCRLDHSHNFFRDSLVPLFFEALAVRPESRNERASNLGDLPYLNGGLFLQTHLEDELYGPEREHATLEVPNDLFDPSSAEEASVLGLLRSYRFTTQESTPDNLSVDPDPELLGKVFENLNEESERSNTGTFYTPREIVRFMCRETLDGYLVDRTGTDKATLERLRREAADPDSEDLRLTVEQRQTIEDALREVTVCDPAVGSGAFPVGMLQEIVELRRGLYQSADTLVSPSGQMVAEWKRESITHSLYGVDINPEAVEICQLRLWLSLVIDADYPEPLPNLDFRFVAGDSLIDRVGGDTLRHSLPTQDHLGLLDPAREERLTAIESELYVLQETYSHSLDPAEARGVRERVRSLQVEATRLQIDWLKGHADSYLSNLRRQYQEKEQLGASARELRGVERQIEAAETRVKTVEELLAGLDPWAAYLKPMLWPVEFPEVMESGGFDIVVANPPYVRQERLTASDQEAYGAAFAEVHCGTADLLVYFFARAIQILAAGGHLGFITSNKYMRAGYGNGIRAFLPSHLTISHIVDFGDLPVFEAAAYPAVLVAANVAPRETHETLVTELNGTVRRYLQEQGVAASVTSVREALSKLESFLEHHQIRHYPQRMLKREGWVLEEPELVQLFERLMTKGVPLGELVQGRMYYGIKTGLNEAFVIDGATRERLVTEDPRSTELIKPWLRGRDIKRWRPEWSGLHIIAIQNSGDADCQNPWRSETNEQVARAIFSNSYPAVNAHLSHYEEQLRPRADQGRFWWELRACTYYGELASNKVVWPEFAYEPRFAHEQAGAFLNNKCYFAAGLPLWAIGVLNSKVIDLMLCFTTTQIRGGYLQLYDHFVRNIPLPEPSSSVGSKLSSMVASLQEDATQSGLLSELEEIVQELYELTDSERDALIQWSAERHNEAVGAAEAETLKATSI